MEKKMETTIMGYIGIIGLVSSLGLYRDYIGIMEKKMETISGYQGTSKGRHGGHSYSLV